MRLAGSLAVVEPRRWEITQKMQAFLAANETEDESCGQSEVTGLLLVDLLIDQAAELAGCGAVGDLRKVGQAHSRLGIDGRHYSRFGNALLPILRDVMGPTLPPRIASAWCDAFWFIVRALRPDNAPELKVVGAVAYRL